jgi:hypothetical protein
VPVPLCTTNPDPLIRLLSVRLSLRLNTNTPLFTIPQLRLPVVPPFPICNVPALIVTAPMVLLAVKINVPAPALTNELVVDAVIVDAKVIVLLPVSNVLVFNTVEVIAKRLEISLVFPLAHCKVAPPATETVPVVPRPPLTNDTVPALTVVPPV